MQIRALIGFTTADLSLALGVGDIATVDDALGEQLIADGLAIEYTEGGLPDYSGASDGDALIIEDGEPTWGAVSGLPAFSNNDKGKALTVVDIRANVDFIPEQEITTEYDENIGGYAATLEDVDLTASDFTDNDIITVTVNGTVYQAEFKELMQTLGTPAFFNEGAGFVIAYVVDEWVYVTVEAATFVINATYSQATGEVEAKWGAGVPIISADDENKVLTAVKNSLPFVPEQTVTLSDGIALVETENIVPDDIVPGTIIAGVATAMYQTQELEFIWDAEQTQFTNALMGLFLKYNAEAGEEMAAVGWYVGATSPYMQSLTVTFAGDLVLPGGPIAKWKAPADQFPSTDDASAGMVLGLEESGGELNRAWVRRPTGAILTRVMTQVTNLGNWTQGQINTNVCDYPAAAEYYGMTSQDSAELYDAISGYAGTLANASKEWQVYFAGQKIAGMEVTQASGTGYSAFNRVITGYLPFAKATESASNDVVLTNYTIQIVLDFPNRTLGQFRVHLAAGSGFEATATLIKEERYRAEVYIPIES